jgi:hypothetical protein
MSIIGRLARTVFILALTLTSQLVLARTSAAQPQTATLEGTATGAKGEVLPRYTVRLRNVDSGAIVATTTSDEKGGFRFTNLAPGNLVVEVVDSDGKVIATTAAISVAAGAAIIGINVSGGAAAIGAGAIAGAAGGGAFIGTTAGIVTIAASAIGASAFVVARVTGEDDTFTPTPPISTPPPPAPTPPPPAPPPPAPPPPAPPAPTPPPPAPPPPPPPLPPPPPPPPPIVPPPPPVTSSS